MIADRPVARPFLSDGSYHPRLSAGADSEAACTMQVKSRQQRLRTPPTQGQNLAWTRDPRPRPWPRNQTAPRLRKYYQLFFQGPAVPAQAPSRTATGTKPKKIRYKPVPENAITQPSPDGRPLSHRNGCWPLMNTTNLPKVAILLTPSATRSTSP